MNNRNEYKRLTMSLASMVILVVLTGIYAYVWYRFYAYSGAIQDAFWRRGNYVVIALYALMLYFFYRLYGGFKVGYLRIFEVLYSQILSVFCVNAITYLQLCLIGRWRFLTFLGPIVYMTVLDLVVVIIWVFFTRCIYTRMFPPRQLLVIYGKRSPDNLVHKFKSRQDKYVIREMVPIDVGFDALVEKISGYSAVVLADIPSHIRNPLLKYCYANNIRCYSVPKISDIMIQNAEQVHLFDTSLLLFRNKGLSLGQRFFKRCFDIVASLVFLVMFSPFMLIIAIAIKLYDGGPVFYTQDRLTLDGRVFRVLKFRSMRVVQLENELGMTRKNDARITPVGKIIRNIHFDELPQLINILKGDMSIVGPRPECPKIAEDYCQFLPEFSFRLKVKAGLTGYAQVYGKYNTTPYDKLKLDLFYIEHYSFLLDLKLILLTFKILFQKENTEGIESWQTNAATQENLESTGKK